MASSRPVIAGVDPSILKNDFLRWMRIKTGIGGDVVRLPPGMVPKQPTDNGPGKVVTLPAPATNAGNTTNGSGKIVTLPARTLGNAGTNTTTSNGSAGKVVILPAGTLGKGGSNQDVRTNVPVNRVTDVKPIRDRGFVKLNNNPPQVNRFQGGNLHGKLSVNSNMNSNARFTQSSGQGGFGRRSFMR
jgi:hypothetical protein